MEEIIEKLRKIKTLAERGSAGEAIAARFMLQKMLDKYGLKVEDLSSEDVSRYSIKYGSTYEKDVILHIYMKVTRKNMYYQKDLHHIDVKLTPLEYAELRNRLEFTIPLFKKEWKKALKAFTHGFIIQQGLARTQDDMTPDEWAALKNKQTQKTSPEELRAIINMVNNLNNVPTYHKQIKS